MHQLTNSPKLIIANWKLHPVTEQKARELAAASDVEGLVIAPPPLFLEAVQETLRKATLGAQDLSTHDEGAYTGEISGKALRSMGVRVVIVGHSERRKYEHETDEMIADKMKAAIDAGLFPVLCIGETAEERGRHRTKKVLERELHIGLSKVPKSAIGKFAIAYEPLWAIGTGEADSPEDFARIANFISHCVRAIGFGRAPILYGGSITHENAADFLRLPELGGLLIGGASLRPKDITVIVDLAHGRHSPEEHKQRFSRKELKNHIHKNLIILTVSIIAGIAIALSGIIPRLVVPTQSFEVVSALIAGFLFTSIFTIGPATVLIASLAATGNPWILALVGGIGAVGGDLILLSFLKNHVTDDIAELFKHAPHKRLYHFLHHKIFQFVAPALGALIIMSPFPDEMGLMLMGLAETKKRYVALLSYCLNAMGILLVITAAKIF